MQYWDGTQWVMIPAGGADRILTRIGTDSIPHWRNRPRGCVADIDGNVYQTVVIGNQEWTVTNIRTSHYSNGDEIALITNYGEWEGLTTGAYCYYSNTTDAAERQKWGALYNWHAVSDSRGLAPVGWRIPTGRILRIT